jgi:hypothetical protein
MALPSKARTRPSSLLVAAPNYHRFNITPPPERLVDVRPEAARVIQSCDVFVDRDGVMYMTDTNAGLYILQYEIP